MMLLRRANLNDYLNYKELYEDVEFRYQWLYYYPIIYDESIDKPLENEFCWDMVESYKNYTIEEFKKDLKMFQIFMIEEDGQILGSVQTFYCGNGTYKLSEWGMFQNDSFTKKRVIEEIKTKLPRAKKIHICTIHKPAREFLISIGFIDIGGMFLELVV